MRKAKNKINIKGNNTKKKGDKFLSFIIAFAIITWFYFIFPPIFILMGNNNIPGLFKIWGIILVVLVVFLAILIFTYNSARKTKL